MSPIEPVWGRAQQNMLSRRQLYDNANQLFAAVLEEWEILADDVEFSQKLVNSIPQRLQAVIASQGGITKY